MASFHFDLVSPEKLLFSGEVDQVDVPGSEGDFGVLAGHAPLIATLRPGILTIYREGGALRVVVNGGFAEVGPTGLTVLADMAVPIEDFDASARRRDQERRGRRRRCQGDASRDKLAHRARSVARSLQAELEHVKLQVRAARRMRRARLAITSPANFENSCTTRS